MSRGIQYSQQFKEDAVKYRKDHPELTLSRTDKNLGINESALKNWIKASKEHEGFVQTRESEIIPVMKQRKLHDCKENCMIQRMHLKC